MIPFARSSRCETAHPPRLAHHRHLIKNKETLHFSRYWSQICLNHYLGQPWYFFCRVNLGKNNEKADITRNRRTRKDKPVNSSTTCSHSSSHRPLLKNNLSETHQTFIPRTTPRFKQALQEQFPDSCSMQDYVRMSSQLLAPLGFCKANTLACVSVCRDEMTKPLVTAIQRTWNNVFSFSGLAGMLFMGKTGFLAAHHHAPYIQGQKRQVFFVFSHIGIGPNGELGFCSRRESPILSPACGALMALQQEVALHGRMSSFDPLDPEQSLIRQRLLNLEQGANIPDLVTLTRRAYRHIVKDLENMIATLLDQDHTHYAVFSGIQIHGPAGKCYMWPGISYSVQHGQRHDFSFCAIPERLSGASVPS